MSKVLFYSKLALTNIRKNRQIYFPYIITSIATVIMFYNISALTYNKTTGQGNLKMILILGVIVTALLAGIFIFYTNSFLVKRRKREFGLYNILGMDKKHIAHVMFWENTYVGGISIVAGIFFGILISKIVTLLLLKILHFDPGYDFEICKDAVVYTFLLFCGIFIITLLNSIIQVFKSKPLELLNSSSVGEKEPKSNWLIAIIGLITLSGGYYIALSVKQPLSAMLLFFVAVVLVIIGTYCFFTSGSITILKMLKKNKRYYYQTKHFVSVSGMIYRMKKNAAGLSNICIMSTAFLVVISTTVSLYVGMDDMIGTMYTEDASIDILYKAEEAPDTADITQKLKNILKEDNIPISSYKQYEYIDIPTVYNGSVFSATNPDNPYNQTKNFVEIKVITAYDYENITGEKLNLNKNTAVIFSDKKYNHITVLGRDFDTMRYSKKPDFITSSNIVQNKICLVVDSRDTLFDMYKRQKEVYKNNSYSVSDKILFNFDMDDKDVIDYCDHTFIDKVQNMTEFNTRVSSKQSQYEMYYSLFGGLFFLGLFIGMLFLIATVLVIYYKQVIEGYEDKEKFTIMKNVGMSTALVKNTINSQVLTVFILPILMAVVHICFAFPMLTRILKIFDLTNVKLFLTATILTIIVFAVFYAIVYYITSKVYYKIVNTKSNN